MIVREPLAVCTCTNKRNPQALVPNWVVRSSYFFCLSAAFETRPLSLNPFDSFFSFLQ